jgi:hypothetical protein
MTQDNKDAAQHQLYKTSDGDAPDAIKDRNGEVCLHMCRVCGKAESELSQPCCVSYNKDAALEIAKECGAVIGVKHVTDTTGEMIIFTPEELHLFYNAARKQLDAARTIITELTEKLAAERQAGRDEVSKELSESEPVAWMLSNPDQRKKVGQIVSFSEYNKDWGFDIPLIIRPTAPK